jgi:hypothetical protein
VRGLQRHVLGCAKHFACNRVEESRLQVDVRVERDVLEHVHLPHFKRVVDEGVAAVTSAYNSVNGEWCGQNRFLLTTVLKERWGVRRLRGGRLGHSPTGRLPFAIPSSADHLPPFDPDARRVEYGELHGQALLDRLGVAAAYPYGFGLTYGDS